MSEWKRVELGEILDFYNGKAIKAQECGTYPIYGSNGKIGFSDTFMYDQSIILGRVGAYCGSVELSSAPFWASDNTIVVKSKLNINLQYCYYLLKFCDLHKYAGGAAQPLITQTILKSLEVVVPSTCSQKKIAQVLNCYDNLIENNNRRIAILEEMAQKLYREWFVHFRFPGHENIKMVESEMGLIPEGWEVDVFSQAVDVNPKYPKPSAPCFSFVDMAGLETNRMIVSIKEQRPSFSGAKFSNGDTLVARITPCLENGKTGFVQCLVDGEIGTGSTEFIVLKSKKLSAEFVYLLSRQDDFRGTLIKSMSGASGRQRANANVLNDFLVCIPSRTVLTAFSAFAEHAFKEIEQLNRKNINLRKTRDLLLPRLISGDIDVSELDIPIREEESYAELS